MTTPRHSIGQARYLEAAACRPYTTQWWFSDGAESVEAYLICMRCPVRIACLTFASDHRDLVGIWGGTTPHERTELRRSDDHPSYGFRAGHDANSAD